MKKYVDHSKGYKDYSEVSQDGNLDSVTGRRTISTTVSQDFHKLAKEHSIKWSEAMRVGLSILFAEKGLREYDNTLNLYRKMRFFQQEVTKYGNKIAELEEKQEALKSTIKPKGNGANED